MLISGDRQWARIRVMLVLIAVLLMMLGWLRWAGAQTPPAAPLVDATRLIMQPEQAATGGRSTTRRAIAVAVVLVLAAASLDAQRATGGCSSVSAGWRPISRPLPSRASRNTTGFSTTSCCAPGRRTGGVVQGSRAGPVTEFAENLIQNTVAGDFAAPAVLSPNAPAP